MAEVRHRLIEAREQQEEALSRSREAVEFMHQRVSNIELGAV
jgi:hypothetical protein